MKKVIVVIFLLIYNVTNAQVSNSLSIHDTRAINDLPNFFQHGIRADFKERIVIGAPGQGIYSTNLTLAQWDNFNNSGEKHHQLNFNNGGVFYRNANPLDSQWGSWREIIIANENGNVGIGITSPVNKLDVNGTIHSKEVKVDMTGWSDFVFKEDYNLPTLEEVEKHITEKGHLENIPTEDEVLKDGINLGEMNAKLLQKIEELTLYIIEMKKETVLVKNENERIKSENVLMRKNQTELEKRILKIENK